MSQTIEQLEKRLIRAEQHIRQLCSTVNTLDKAQGGNGRKCRIEDFLEGVTLPPYR
mgnify:CR=1 FL=1